MTIWLGTPSVDGLGGVARVLGEWQVEAGAVQLHPGDLGWFRRFGGERTAAATRVWERDGETVAIGLLDEPDLLRLAFAPAVFEDEELAAQVAADIVDPSRGVLIEGKVYVEAPVGARVKDLLSKEGWGIDDPWTPLKRELTEPVEDSGLAIEVIAAETAHIRTAVQRAAFDGSTFIEERWHAMAEGEPYANARCLVGRDGQGEPVAAVTVWSAGPGKPGVLEPMGVHRDFRGNGYGQAITLAAAAMLRELGSSSALVLTPSFNVGAVATYRSAGFEPLPETHDQVRSG
ncbi:GNAT family N-acetyltransferase [Kribbella qitaiheensis]|uniref:GNAT family N-acetyltransferase n=1 Tax=Kribbella qitaiheensis TaxID=1544730 RepID=A0A7G6X7R5_9ACTN|nr:GNAT family N-acetyltransferase [Kribbella qitaiheensis]QNE22280.1 GNAT family N-acetyltransferase [Kribbella qitaiheensis]